MEGETLGQVTSDLIRFPAVHGGGELRHVQPSELRLLRVPPVGQLRGVVPGHVLDDHGAALRHLQTLHPAGKVLQRKSEPRLLGQSEVKHERWIFLSSVCSVVSKPQSALCSSRRL